MSQLPLPPHAQYLPALNVRADELKPSHRIAIPVRRLNTQSKKSKKSKKRRRSDSGSSSGSGSDSDSDSDTKKAAGDEGEEEDPNKPMRLSDWLKM